MKNINFIVVQDITDDFSHDWVELWNNSPYANFFNSYFWFKAACEALQIESYKVFALYNGNKLISVFPTICYRKFGIKVNGSVANEYLYNTGFLIESLDQKLLKYFFSRITNGKNIYITRIEDRVANTLHKLFPDIFFSTTAAAPYLKSETNLLIGLSDKHLRHINKIIYKNKEYLRVEIYTKKDDLEKILQLMFKLDQKSSKKRKSRDIFSSARTRQFFTSLVKWCRPIINICVCYYKDEPFVYMFYAKIGNSCLLIQTSFLREYKWLYPGKIVLVELLEKLRADNISYVDFGAGINSFKQEFTSDYYTQYDMYYSKNKLTVLWWKLINTVRRIKKIYIHEKFTDDHLFLFKELS